MTNDDIPPVRGARRSWRRFVVPRGLREMDDEERRLLASTLDIFLIGAIAALATLDAIIFLYSHIGGADYNGVSFAELSVLLAFFAFLYALAHRGFIAPAAYLLSGACFFAASYLSYEWGANWEVAVLSFALAIVVASVLLGTALGIITTVAAGSLTIFLWYLQRQGLVQVPRGREPEIIDAAAFAALYVLIMVAAYLFGREADRSREMERRAAGRAERLYRLAEFGKLSSGLLHDTLNLMNAALLCGGQSQNYKINERVKSLARAIRHQLVQEEAPELFSITDGIKEVMQLVSFRANALHAEISFAWDIKEDFTWVGEPFKLHQVMMNLVMNALESGGTNVAITAERRAAPGWNGFAVRVSDNGCGIPQAIREKIFEPFFTTKTSSHGIGIGLATAKKIIENDLRGTIEVASEEGKGSTFTVKFPDATTPVAPSEGIEPP